LKRVIYVLIVATLVVFSYFAIFNYLKTGGVKILQDTTAKIQKGDETYLHYKVLNNKLLNDYGCDLRTVISDTKILKPPKKLRKGANSFLLTTISPDGEITNVETSKNLKEIFDKNFINKIKSNKYDNTKTALIKVTEKILDREIEFKK